MLNLFLVLAALQMPVHYVSGASAIVYFPPNVQESTANGYLSAINQMYAGDTTRFKISRDEPIKVRLCHDAYEFADLTGKDSIFSPLWKNETLYILIQNDLNDSGYRSALESGVIRVLLDQLHQNGAPWWLISAAAAYESGEYKSCFPPPVIYVTHFADLEEKIQSASTPVNLSDLCFYLGMTGKFFDMRFGAGSLAQN